MVARSSGQSAIARAAYNAREKLIDHRTGKVHDFRYLGEPEWKAILGPEGAQPWSFDREGLWNTVERREDQSTRPDDAQPARDFKIALPFEFDAGQRRELVAEYAQYLANKGMVVDAAIHVPDLDDDPRNYHVHLLATTRSLLPDGFGNKVREWNRDSEFWEWRVRWSELGADHLQRAGFQLEAERFRVGHFTNQKQRELAIQRGDYEWAQQLDRTPQKHMGPHAWAMEDRGIWTRKGDVNRDIDERNEERKRGLPLSRVDGEIRLAFQLTDRAQAFADALEDRGLLLARVGPADLEKLAAIDARKIKERADAHTQKLAYCDRRIREEEQGSNADQAAEFRERREVLEKEYQAGLPWMMGRGGVPKLTDQQRTAAQRRYDQWKDKAKQSFENYVAYVQEQWRTKPGGRTRFSLNDLVVIDQDGDVHPLTQRTTGEEPRLLRKYLREIDTSPLFSVTGAWEVVKELHQHRREEKDRAEGERFWPIHPPELLREERPWPSSAHLSNKQAQWDRAAHRTTRDSRPLNPPDEISKPRSLRFPEAPDAAHIWEAYNRNSHSATAFVEALDTEEILLCSVSKAEADRSHRAAAFARELSRYSPKYKEGEIVAMGRDARVYRLTEDTVGAKRDDLERMFKKLDRSQLPTMQEGTGIMQERAAAREAGAQLMKLLDLHQGRPGRERPLGSELRSLTRDIRRSAAIGIRSVAPVATGAARLSDAAGKMFEGVARSFESLFAPVLSPEEKRLAQLQSRVRELDELEVQRRNRSQDRER